MIFNFYSNFLFILSIGMFILFIYSIFQDKNRLSNIFSLLCLAMTTYNFFYAFELMSNSIDKIMFFLKLEYFGTAFIPPLWLILAYKFYSQKSYNLKFVLFIFLIPLITLIMVNTNEAHHLFYKNVSVITYKNLGVAKLDKGIWYIVSSCYSYIALFSGQLLFFRAWQNSKNNKKKQATLLLTCSLLPLVLSIIYLMGLTPSMIDPMPFSYAIVSLFYFIAIFKYGFLEMKEIVREASFEQIKKGIIVSDSRGRLIDFNITATSIFSWMNTSNLGLYLENFSKSLSMNTKELFELKIGNRNYEFRTTFIKEKNKISGKLYIFQDITEKKLLIDKLEYNAKYDFLSRVYNRHYFFELAQITLANVNRYKSPLSILMLDIDFFKKINDNFGHVAGDMVIKTMSKKIKEYLRFSDIIGRYGGEEFIILLPETTLQDALTLGEDIRSLVEKLEINFNDNFIKVTVSLGVALCKPFQDIKLQTLINNADTALYIAKNNGRNRVEAFDDSL